MNNNKKAVILAVILLLVSIGITIYPLIANALAEKYRSEIQTKYFEKIEAMNDEALDSARADAEKYNRLLTSGVVQNNFSDEALDLANVGYEAILNLNADGIMGYIEIPRTDTYLPISHGTEAETLEKAVGHVIGSSLPIGGEGTHSVLSGHSGRSDQKMFSDVEELHLGDIFYLHVLNETLAYKVTSIDTVLPEDTSLLGIEPDKDMVTLVTCTPFGVNTHRLLVRGERTDYEEAVVEVEEMEEAVYTQSAWTRQYYRGILIGIAGLCFLLTIYGMIQTKGDGWS